MKIKCKDIASVQWITYTAMQREARMHMRHLHDYFNGTRMEHCQNCI